MSTKNFVSNGDAETLFTGIGNKLSTLKSGLTNLDNEVNGDATVYPYADVITIEDAVPANVADCTVKIEPVQSGSGDPSPTNVRPITGHSRVDIFKSAENLFASSAKRWNIDTNGTIITGNNYDSYIAPVVKSGKYVITGSNAVLAYGFFKTIPEMDAVSYDGQRHYTPDTLDYNIISPIDGYILVRFAKGVDGVAFCYGDQYTITLGDTIYGGTVDFDSGVMTVDRATATVTTLARNTDNSFYQAILPAPKANQTNISQIICDRATTGDRSNINTVFINASSNLRVNTAVACSTGAEAIEYYGGSLTVCYELATPFTVQLTPQQIQLLQGQNTLTASTGQISVTVNGVSGAIGQVQEQVNGLQTDLSKGYLVKTFNVEGHANDASIDFSALKPSDYNGFVNAYSCNGSGAVIQKCKNDVIYFVDALGVDATITIVYTVSQ